MKIILNDSNNFVYSCSFVFFVCLFCFQWILCAICAIVAYLCNISYYFFFFMLAIFFFAIACYVSHCCIISDGGFWRLCDCGKWFLHFAAAEVCRLCFCEYLWNCSRICIILQNPAKFCPQSLRLQRRLHNYKFEFVVLEAVENYVAWTLNNYVKTTWMGC